MASGEAKLFRCIKAGRIVRFIPSWNNPVELIEPWARSKPGRPAVSGWIENKRFISRTYCQLLRRIFVIAKALSEQPDHRLAILCGSHVATAESVLSALAADRQFVMIDLLRKPVDLQWFKFADSRADVAVIPAIDEMPDALVDRISQLRRDYPGVKIWSVGENPLAELNLLAAVAEGTRLGHLPYSPDAWTRPAALLYSPGRHGSPRGFFYQPTALCANLCAVASWLKLTPRSRFLLATELDSCDGIIPLLATLSAGGAAIIHPNVDGGNFWKIIPECDADLVRAKPSLIEELLENNPRLATINRSNLKFLITGSAYLPRQIGLRFFETFDLPILQCYGTAETGGYVLGMSPGLSWREYELALRDNIVGQELDYCNVKVKSEPVTLERATPINEGILQVRGHVVSCGQWDGNEIHYWTEPWINTPDMAVGSPWQDQQHFQVRGRLEDTILVDNQRFWPAFIERSILDTFQFLRDCVAMTLPHPDGRNRLCAIVVLPSDVPPHRRSELMALMEARFEAGGVSGLNDKSTPKELIPLDERQVPRQYDGHPDRQQLHQLILQQTTRQGLAAS